MMSKLKLDFKKPFSSAVFKKISNKPTKPPITSDSDKMAPKSTAKKPSEKKVIGSPLSDEYYENLFDSVIKLYSQDLSTAETDTSFDNSEPVSNAADETGIEKESDDQLSRIDSNIIPNSIDGAAGSEKSKNENVVEKKQPAFAKPTAVPKKSPGFKRVSSSNVADKSKESTDAKELSRPLVPTTSVDASVSNSSSSDAKNYVKTGENRNDVEKTSSKPLISKKSTKSVDKKKRSEPSEKNSTKSKKTSNKLSCFTITKKQGKPKDGFKLPSTSSSKENQSPNASSFEPESSKIDMPSKSSSSAISKKQGTPKGSSKLVESEPSTSSSLTLNQSPGASTANDSSTIDVYDFEEDEEGTDTGTYLNTQNTIWGRDRGIVYDPLPRSKNYKEQMLHLRKSRNIGLWVQCCNKDCGKYRYCQDLKDPLEVPKIWTCSMNTDLEFNSCLVPQQRQPWSVENEVDVLESKYTAGSVVWAMVPGYPWWPAIIDDDPNVEMFWWLNDPTSSKPVSYHVVFFDQKVSRAWVNEGSIQPFYPNKNNTPKNFRERRGADMDHTIVDSSQSTSPMHTKTAAPDDSSEDDNSQKRIQRRHPTATATPSRLHSSIHGERKTRKRQLISKKKRSLKRQKMMRQYLAKKPYCPIVPIYPESDSTEDEEEEEQGSENENEPMQIDEKEGAGNNEIEELDDDEERNVEDDENEGVTLIEPMQIEEQEELEISDKVSEGTDGIENDYGEEINVEDNENEGGTLIEPILIKEQEKLEISNKVSEGTDGIEPDDDGEEINVEDENEGEILIEDSDEDEKSIIADKENINEKEEHVIRDEEGKGTDGIEEANDDDEEINVEDENEGEILIEDSDEDEKSIIADKENINEKEEHVIRDEEGKGTDGIEEPDCDGEEINVEDENEGEILIEDSDEDEKSIISDKGNLDENDNVIHTVAEEKNTIDAKLASQQAGDRLNEEMEKLHGSP